MTELELFEAALERSPADRAAFLDNACVGNQRLRHRLQALLARHDLGGDFLEGPAADFHVTVDQPSRERPGSVIASRYKLLEQIGEGGMGTVWVAEQTEPVKRRVALKLIKPGMDSRQVLSRFEAERQALALMDHPNIAKVFDGGMTDGGRPFFVMEYVKGVPITEYCDNVRLSIQKRLKLFAQVCQAVQHAHQKGIIHRDLKPSNILVCLYDGQPVPKVIDFGLAKAMDRPLTEHTLYTAHGLMVGTPLYMSPEQAEFNNLDIDTRSDIYSLGVILYELLTGTTPLEKRQFKDAAFQEILRLIKEVEPPRPSLKISSSLSLPSLAAQRSLEPAQLRRAVRGDLDWIVMKALEKERSRRYETANGLARDVDRYLCDEPVEACPPSAGYRLKKLLRRNKGPALAAVIVLLTLVGGIIGTTWGLIRAEKSRQAEAEQRTVAEAARNLAQVAQQRETARAEAESQQRQRAESAEAAAKTNEQQATAERDRAEQEKRIAQAVKDFLQKRLLNQADATNQGDSLVRAGGSSAEIKENPTIRELLDRAAAELTPEKIETQFPNLPLVQAEILGTIGDTYRRLGEYGPAIAHLERSRHLYVTHRGPDQPETLTTLNNLALAYMKGGKFPQATQLFEQLRDKQIAMLGPDHPDTLTTLHNLAWTFRDDLRNAESIKLFEQVRDKRIATLGPDHLDTLYTLHELAASYNGGRKFPEAIQLFEHVRDRRIAKLGPDHPDTLWTLHGLAWAYQGAGKLTEAIQIFEQVRDKRIAIHGLNHHATQHNLNSLALAYGRAGRSLEAIQLLEQLRDSKTATIGPEHPNILIGLSNLAFAYQEAGRSPEAIQLLEQVRDKFIATLGPDDAHTLRALSSLALAYRTAGRLPEAIQLCEEMRDNRMEKLGPDDPASLAALNNLAYTYQIAGRLPDALRLWEELVPTARRVFGPAHSSTILYTSNWCNALDVARESGKAADIRRELLDIQRQQLDIQRQQFPATDPRLASALAALGQSLLKADQFTEAEPILNECLTIREKALPDSYLTFHAKSLLGGALAGQKKYAEAEPLLLAGYEGMKQREAKIPASVRANRLTEALQRLIDLYTAWDKPEEVAKWRKNLVDHKTAKTPAADPTEMP